ncbi:diguanylate cyclase domain-containing protein [Amedibacillus sp. YH-ame10]
MKRISKGVIGVVILLLIMSSSFYVFSSYINELSNHAMENFIQQTSVNNSKSMTTLVKNDGKLLKGIARWIELQKQDREDEEKLINLLKRSRELTNFDHLVIYSKDGKILSDNASVAFVADEAIQTIITTGELQVSSLYDENSVGITVPIYEKGEIVGAIRGIYKSESVIDVMNTNTFGEDNYFSVVNIHGEFLYETDTLQDLYHGNNAFEVLKDADFKEGFSLEKMRESMRTKENFLMRYTLDNKERVVFCMPSQVGDWYIMSAVPASSITALTNRINFMAIILMITVGIVFVILLLIILRQNRKSKQQLQNAYESMERILGNLPMPMFVIGKDKTIRQVNQAACEVFQKTKEELLHQPCKNLHTSICNTENCVIKRLLAGQSESFMNVGERKYQVSSTFLLDKYQKAYGYIEVMQDITELMDIQNALEERTLELEAISENLMCGILTTTLEEGFPVIQCNQGYLDLIGAQENEVIGQPATKWLLNEEASSVESSIFKQLQEDGVVRLEHMLQNDKKDKIWISVRGKTTKLQNQPVGIWLIVNIDERKKAELETLINEQRYRIALENTEDIIIDYDLEKDIMMHSDRVMDVYGVPTMVEHPKENIVKSGIIAQESVEEFANMFDELHKGVDKSSYEVLTHAKDDRDLWVRITFTTIFDGNGNAVRAIGILHDINDEKKALQNYKREAQYRKITTEDAALYYEADLTSRKFLRGHEALVKAYSPKPTDDFDTIVELMLKHLVYSADQELVRQHITWDSISDAYEKGVTKIDFEYQRVLGGEHNLGWVHCSVYILKDEESDHVLVIGYIKDIDEAKKLELYLKEQAQIDLLTGVYNKITTENMIKDSLMKQEDGLCALMIIDLDDFKRINDSLGHAFGDAVLSEVSGHLKELFRKDDIIGRVGGDEFIVYLRKLGVVQEALDKAASICQMFKSSYTGAKNYKVSGSIGIAFAPNDGEDFETLYKNADIALYSAKNGGKDTYCAFREELPQIGSQLHPRNIDSNYGKQLSENIGEFVLRILYEAKEPEKVINAVLELLSRQFGYSRGYVFEHDKEHDDWVNTFEWCEIGIPAQKDNFQKLHFSTQGYFESFYDESGVFMMSDMKDLDTELYEAVKDINLKSFIQYALKKDGVMTAFIGFDNYKCQHIPDQAEMEALRNVVMLLDVFVFRNKTFNA